MLKHTIASLSLGLLSAALSAQTCSTLTVTGSGMPGTALDIAVDGPSGQGFTVLMVGMTQGSTMLNFGPFASLNIDLATPFLPVPLGMTDANGDVARTLNIPANVSFPAVNLFGQGVTLSFSFMSGNFVSFCTSDVASFSVGV